MKSITIGDLLHRAIRAINICKPPAPDQRETVKTIAIDAVTSDLSQYLPQSKLSSGAVSGIFRKRLGSFYSRFFEGRIASDTDSLAGIRQDQPNLHKFGLIASSYLRSCREIEQPLNSAFARLLYQALPYFKPAGGTSLMQAKSSLPTLGLLYFPNPEPLDFIVDAVRGEFNVEIVDPGKLLQEFWQGREVDFAQYEIYLRELVAKELDRFQIFADLADKNRTEAIELMSKHIQFQMAIAKYTLEKRWDLLVLGAMEMSLGQTLQDISAELRPPLVMFYHGVPTGEPIENLFSLPDYVITRIASEGKFYKQLGISENQILRVGSLANETFPTVQQITRQRNVSRDKFSFSDEDRVIIWALTYTPGYQDTLSHEDCLSLVLGTLQTLSAQPQFAGKIILYLKYHPAPRSDTTFSYSRTQFPLQKIYRELSALGIRVYVRDDIQEVLYAADLLLAHESTILLEGVEACVPTVSLKNKTGPSEPLLSAGVYDKQCTHRFCHESVSPEKFINVFEEIIDTDIDTRIKDSQIVWQENFSCGRTEGMVKLVEFLKATVEKGTNSVSNSPINSAH